MKYKLTVAIIGVVATLFLVGCGGGGSSGGGGTPLVTLTFAGNPPTYTSTTTTPINVTLTFGEALSADLTAGDLTVTGATPRVVKTSDPSNRFYALTLTPSGMVDIVVTLPANKVMNAAGKGNDRATFTITYDSPDMEPAPSLTATFADNPPTYTTTTTPINVTLTFGEALSADLTAGDLTVNGATPRVVKTSDPSNRFYALTLTPSGMADIVVTLPANKVMTAAGTGNALATFTITYMAMGVQPATMCPALDSITNGLIVYSPDNSPDYDLGTVAKYECNDGFVLDLSATGAAEMRTCAEDNDGDAQGIFSNAAPMCMVEPPMENLITPAPRGGNFPDAVSYVLTDSNDVEIQGHNGDGSDIKVRIVINSVESTGPGIGVVPLSSQASIGLFVITDRGFPIPALLDYTITPNDNLTQAIFIEFPEGIRFRTNRETSLFDDSQEFTITIPYEAPPTLFSVADNGVTIVANPGTAEGATGMLNGVEYTYVDRDLLISMRDEDADLSRVVTTGITDMNRIFSFATAFNQDISSWDVSSVTDINRMFQGASVFNQDISKWDVSSVTNMNRMFNSAALFNQDISEWDVRSVTDMTRMFSEAPAFNQDISGWMVGQVTLCSNFSLSTSADWLANHKPIFPVGSDCNVAPLGNVATPLPTPRDGFPDAVSYVLTDTNNVEVQGHNGDGSGIRIFVTYRDLGGDASGTNGTAPTSPNATITAGQSGNGLDSNRNGTTSYVVTPNTSVTEAIVIDFPAGSVFERLDGGTIVDSRDFIITIPYCATDTTYNPTSMVCE